MAREREGAKGRRASAMAEGRCVKTMVRMRPMRLESEAAIRAEKAERRAAMEKTVPREEGGRWNLVEKK